MLFIEIVGDGDHSRVAEKIRALDSGDIVSVVAADFPGSGRPVGFRVAVPGAHAEVDVAESVDVSLAGCSDLETQAVRLWNDRLRPLAMALSGHRTGSYPAEIRNYDPQWMPVARRRLDRIRQVLNTFDAGREFAYDHIGSTAVPGLGAKAVVDLQVRVPAIPDPAVLDPAMFQIGYLSARGSRPDSPGVYRDNPRGGENVPDVVWAKRLFYCPDPVLPSILHLRRADSPFGRHTVWFRDWLRAHPEQRERYQAVKRRLAAEHAGDADYDDYTRAKTQFFDDVQHVFENWARRHR